MGDPTEVSVPVYPASPSTHRDPEEGDSPTPTRGCVSGGFPGPGVLPTCLQPLYHGETRVPPPPPRNRLVPTGKDTGFSSQRSSPETEMGPEKVLVLRLRGVSAEE